MFPITLKIERPCSWGLCLCFLPWKGCQSAHIFNFCWARQYLEFRQVKKLRLTAFRSFPPNYLSPSPKTPLCTPFFCPTASRSPRFHILDQPIYQCFIGGFPSSSCSLFARYPSTCACSLSWTWCFWRRFLDFPGAFCESRTCSTLLWRQYLSDKGGVVGVSKVGGEDVFGEFLHLFDDKALAIFGPTNDIAVLGILRWG